MVTKLLFSILLSFMWIELVLPECKGTKNLWEAQNYFVFFRFSRMIFVSAVPVGWNDRILWLIRPLVLNRSNGLMSVNERSFGTKYTVVYIESTALFIRNFRCLDAIICTLLSGTPCGTPSHLLKCPIDGGYGRYPKCVPAPHPATNIYNK